MSLSLLMPLGLAALAALLLPLLIHLVRRNEQRQVSFAALRWLAAKAQPRRKRRFEEWLLLALRLLLLAALALLLAGPVLHGRPDRTPWVVVVPGAGPATLRPPQAGDEERFEARWLAPGFPALLPSPGGTPSDGAMPSAPSADDAAPPPTASLLRELDAQLPAGTPLTVLVPPVLDGADAERPVLSRRVAWKVVDAAPLPAAQGNGDAAAAEPRTAPPLMVRHALGREAGVRYLRAAAIAWQAATDPAPTAMPAAPTAVATPSSLDVAAVSEPLDRDIANLVWLAPGPLPAAVRDWVAAGGSALVDVATSGLGLEDAAVLLEDESGSLVRGARLGRGRLMQLQRELSPGAMPLLLEPTFPARLRELFAAPVPAPTRVAARDYAPRIGAPPPRERARPLAPWLAALIAALFAVERWVANGPRRREAK